MTAAPAKLAPSLRLVPRARRTSVRVLKRPIPDRMTYRAGEECSAYVRVRQAIDRLEAERAQSPRRVAPIHTARRALHEISNLVALVGLNRPNGCDLVDEVLAAIDRACGRTGGAS